MGLWSKIRGDVFGSLAGGIIGSFFGGNSAKKQSSLQRDNWAYQQSNAHQLEVQDLKAAGLNPILSATNSQIAGMGSAPSTSDNGITSALSASMSKALDRQANLDIAKTNAEIARINADTERIKAGIRGDDTSAANSRFDAETGNIVADTALKTANSNYLIGETANSAKRTNQDIAESKERIKQIQQDIDNSIEITKATVNKYGAEAEASRAVAAQSYATCKLILEQTIGQQLDNQQVQRILDNPKAELDADTWDYVKSRPFWSSLYSLGQYIKEISPFGNASIGYHRSNQNRSSTSVRTIDHNYNHNKK